MARLGLAAIGVAALLGIYLSNQIPDSLWAALLARYEAGGTSLVSFLALGAVAINLFIAGALAIITDARHLSLSNPRTRKGIAIMWIGAAALTLGLLAAQAPTGRNDVLVEWVDAAAPVTFGLIAVGILLVRTGWKHDVRGAHDVLATDTRPPVIYLRSFQDDVRSPIGGGFGLWLKVLMWFQPISFEQELAAIMNRLGPFVAIGKPGEKLPELGANRFYFRDDEWQERVAELVQRARLTIILYGGTANLWWEIDHVFRSVTPDRVVLVIPERGKRTRQMEEQVEERLGFPGALIVDAPKKRTLIPSLLFGKERPLGKIVYFSPDGRPHVQPLIFVPNTRPSLALLRTAFSAYGGPLDSAFETVFAALHLPWTPAMPSRTIAIVLAATFGLFGLHLWYLGDRGRAAKYLKYCWTMGPLVLGIRDAVRLVLMDQAEFERRHGPAATVPVAARSH
jgi:hypothetical protein